MLMLSTPGGFHYDPVTAPNGSAHASTEYWSFGSFRSGPDLPQATHKACLAAINDTHAVLTGGVGTEKSALLLDTREMTWTALPDMPIAR